MQTRCNGYIDFYFGSSRTLEKPFFCGYLCDAFETIKLTKQKNTFIASRSNYRQKVHKKANPKNPKTPHKCLEGHRYPVVSTPVSFFCSVRGDDPLSVRRESVVHREAGRARARSGTSRPPLVEGRSRGLTDHSSEPHSAPSARRD